MKNPSIFIFLIFFLTSDIYASKFSNIKVFNSDGDYVSYEVEIVTSPEEQEIIIKYIELLQEKEIFSNDIVTEIKPLKKFYYAEEYHKNYKKNNPNNPYVRQVSIPRLRKFQNAYPDLLKENH